MAYPVGGGACPHHAAAPVPVRYRGAYLDGSKRRVSHGEADYDYDAFHAKRARHDAWDAAIDYAHPPHDHGYDSYPNVKAAPPNTNPLEHANRSFIVIREGSPAPNTPLPGPGVGAGAACAMERTQSGLSISSDTSRHSCNDEIHDRLMSDLAAARLVREHVATFSRRCRDSRHARILKALINPKSRATDFSLDEEALQSIFSAANELFFANRLSRRVTWDWSHSGSTQYQSHIVGTTALRRSATRDGYETLIVLSSPILKDTKYNRRLLISTFLHEMIHSYLFVTCGLKARDCGGHTEGFHIIAQVIDSWVGKEHLRLSEMDADLGHFRGEGQPPEEDEVVYDHDMVDRGRTQLYAPPPQDFNGRLMEPQPRWRPDYDDWQWHNQEGFRSRSAHSAGSSYVY